jgi:hypothetical protein
MVIVDPAVMNRTEWSALDIASNVYEGKLPVPGGMFDEGLLEIALIYVLMVFALMALYLPGPPRALNVISGIGFAASSLAKFWNFAFVQTFFGYFGHTLSWHMSRGPAWWVLPWVMPAILLVCFADSLDN